MNVLIILPGFIPSTTIGVLRPLSILEKRGEIKTRLSLTRTLTLTKMSIDWCDVAVFCRNCEIQDLKVLYELKKSGKKVIYEIDDNFEEISLNTGVGVYHRSVFRLHVLKRFFELSDVTRIYSERLEQRAVEHGANVQRIKSYFDETILDNISKNQHSSVIKIAYPTGRIDDPKIERLIFNVAKSILEKYSDKVEFHLWHKKIPLELEGIQGVVLNPKMANYEKFVQSFYKLGFDIGLAPGVDTPFFHSKTNNKYREFGGCGIAGVYSNFPPYSECVIHEQTGLLVDSNEQDWLDAISHLIDNIEFRQKLVRNAKIDVSQNYSFNESVENWHMCLKECLNRSDSNIGWLPTAKSKYIYTLVGFSEGKNLLDGAGKKLDVYDRINSNMTSVSITPITDLNDLVLMEKDLTCIYILNDEIDFSLFSETHAKSSSLIVDLTTYNSDLDAALEHLQNVAKDKSTSVLISVEQAKNSHFLKRSPSFLSVGLVKLGNMEDAFSLSGYTAGSLDLIEKHTQYTTSPKIHKLSRLKNKIERICDSIYLKANTIIKIAKYYLGMRKF